MTRHLGVAALLVGLFLFASPAWATLLGPDGGGYRLIDTVEPANPHAPPFVFTPITGTTVTLGDDQFSAPIPLGFNFTYYGVVRTQVFICSNGFLSFTGDNPSFIPAAIPNAATPNEMICGNWTDLNPTLGGTISYATTGAAPHRVFTAEWLDIQHFGGGFPIRMQILLFEECNDIEIRIDNGGSNGFANAVVGIEDGSGTIGLQYFFGADAAPAAALDNRSIRFTTRPITPDAFGYWSVDSCDPASPGRPEFNFTPITGTTLTLGDDQQSAAIPLPFTFTYYGTGFNQVFVDSNGYLSFAVQGSDFTADPIPNAGAPNGIVCFNWNDLVPNVSGTVRHTTGGTAPRRFFVVEFNGVGHFSSGANPIQVQCFLVENGDIIIQAQTITSDGSLTVVGIENNAGTIGLNYLNSTTAGTLINQRAIRFTTAPFSMAPFVPPAAVTDLTCSAVTTTTVTLTWTQPGENGNFGTATTADLRRSFTNITSMADYDAATQLIGEPPPTGAGNPATYTDTGLPPDTDVFYAITYLDAEGNRSALSNVALCHTQDIVPPDPVTDLRITNITGSIVTVAWTNTGDNGSVGNAASVDIRFRADGCIPLVAGDFAGAAAPPIQDPTGEPVPTGPGTTQTFTFDVGAPFTTFNVAMVVRDEVPNTSGVSNQPVCGTTGAPTWQPPIIGSDSGGEISNTGAFSVDPCMDLNPITNQPGVVWTDRDTVGGDLEMFFRESNGTTFAEIAGSASGGGLSANTTPSQLGDVAYDAAGRPVVFWQDVDTTGGDADVYVRRLDAGAWNQLSGSATGSGVSANNTSSTHPSGEINPVTGQPGVAWVDFQLGDFEIFFREFDGALWQQFANSGQNQGLSNNTGVSLQPSLTYDALGRPVIAWADNSSGNFEIYLRRFNPALTPPAWEELAGSASGGGISMSPTQVSQNPSVQVDGGNNPCVIWQETLANGNVEIYGRRFDGTRWVDFGPGSAQGGGISNTPGRSQTPELCLVPGFFDVFLAVWADFSHAPGRSEIYAKWFDNGQWREIGTFSARFGGVSNTATDSLSPCCAVGGGRAFISWQEFSGGNYEVFVRSLVLLAPVADSNHEFIVGGGTGGRGEYRVFDNGTTVPPFTPLDLRVVPFAAAYNANPGTLHPACGDVDGDGLDEVILGQGFAPGQGFVAVMRDHTGRYDQLAMLRFPWTAYNNANGTVYPALGDIDGDGRDEILMGMGRFAGGGFFAVFDDQVGLFAFRRFVRAGTPAYNGANGELHPACGDVDGDGVDEVVIGLAQGGSGLVTVRDDLLRDFSLLATIVYPNSAYNSSNGTTWPACGNLTGGNGTEIVVGPGRGGLGVAAIFGDRAQGFKRVGALQFPWRAYNNVSGELRPAVGNLDPDLPLEVVAGTGPFPGATTGGFLFVFNDVTTGAAAPGRFVRYLNSNVNYNRDNGETFPATGQLR